MTEKKSADDVLSILRNEAAKAVAASYEDGLRVGMATQAEPRASNEQPDKGQLQEQFNARITSLNADTRKTPAKARAIQDEFMEAGLSWEDVDLAGPQPNWKGHRVGDGPPSSR